MFLVVSIAQILNILKDDNSVFIINLCEQALELMASLEPNAHFVLEEILHLLGSHAKCTNIQIL